MFGLNNLMAGPNLGGKNFPLVVAMAHDYASRSSQILPISAATLFRSSSSRISIAFIAGFALGAVVGIFGFKFGNYFFSSHRRSDDRLTRELEIIQKDLDRQNQSSAAVEGYLDVDDVGDDEFFDVASGISSDANDDFLSARSSSASLFSLAAPPNRPLPPEMALNLDKLVQTASCATAGPDLNSKAEICYFTCLDYKKRFKHHPGFLWRFARAVHFMYLSKVVDPKAAEGSSNSEWVDLGLSIARSAVRQADIARAAVESSTEIDLEDAAEVRRDAARAYQWLATFIGLTTLSPDTAITQRIQLGYDFERYISISLEIDPNNAFCHILKGRWCFEVYNLSWIERQLASRLFATPPTATLDDAKAEFLEAERLAPKQWAVNALFLAKCEFAASNYEAAIQWLKSADRLLHQSISPSEELGDGDSSSSIGDLLAERPLLQKEVEELMPRYRAYFIG
ncbi:hypothetical protein Aperf_G00000093134 [Anoplocephala perfoliata]